MAQTIEAFVEKLHGEGVEAGKQAAEKLLKEAQAEAERTISEATAKGESIIAEAKATADRLTERQQSELDLAIRDAVLSFRDAIGKAVEALLSHEVDKTLCDKDFLLQLIHDTVVNYAEQDSHGAQMVQINVCKDVMGQVADWALKYLGDTRSEADRPKVNLKGALHGHGFEYRVGDSTVEVTVESIVGVLKEHMSARLREVLDRALADVKGQ